jgi:hypothetical protein
MSKMYSIIDINDYKTELHIIYKNNIKPKIQCITSTTKYEYIKQLINDFFTFKFQHYDTYYRDIGYASRGISWDTNCPFVYELLKTIFLQFDSQIVIRYLGYLIMQEKNYLIERCKQLNIKTKLYESIKKKYGFFVADHDLETVILTYTINYSNEKQVLDYTYNLFKNLISRRKKVKLIEIYNNTWIEEYISFTIKDLVKKQHFNTIEWLFEHKDYFMTYKEVDTVYGIYTKPIRHEKYILYKSFDTYKEELKENSINEILPESLLKIINN